MGAEVIAGQPIQTETLPVPGVCCRIRPYDDRKSPITREVREQFLRLGEGEIVVRQGRAT